MSDRTYPLRKRIAQLEAEVRAVRKQAQAQRKRITQKCGYEFLSLVDSDRNCKLLAGTYLLIYDTNEVPLLTRA